LSTQTWMGETFDIVTASERLQALAVTAASCTRTIADILDAAPDLAPEMRHVEERICEAIGHVQAAQAVLKARLDLLKER